MLKLSLVPSLPSPSTFLTQLWPQLCALSTTVLALAQRFHEGAPFHDNDGLHLLQLVLGRSNLSPGEI